MTARGGVARRSHAHERALLLGIALLILLGTLPVFAHHLPLPGTGSLGDVERVGAICLVALHLVLAPVHGTIHLLLLAGATYALFDRLRAASRLRRGLIAMDLARVEPESRLAKSARQAGIDPARILMARVSGCPAFTFGALVPRICISRALVEELTDQELLAVVAHEASHLRRRDPLRLSLLHFLALTLFWIPALRRMSEDVAVEAELDADAAGDMPLAMASALVKAAKQRTSLQLVLITPLVRDDLLAVRVRRLAGEPVAPPSRITKRALVGATAALLVVWLSGAVVAHPLHTEHGVAATCLQHSGWPGSHLFCARHVAGAEPCPHALALGSSTSHAGH